MSSALKDMTLEIAHFINGKSQPGRSARSGPVYDPATGTIRARVPFASAAEVDLAVAAAAAAFPGWAALSPQARARVLFKYLQVIDAHAEELIDLIVGEHGKVREDARGSLTRGREVVEFACGIPHLLKGEHSNNVASGIDSWSMRQPLGVCAGITPFNFPAMVPLWMFPIAIACGNAFIVKPSEKVPSCMTRLAQLAREAGVPDGILNVVHGDRETVDALLAHPGISAISFVGSTPVARHVYQTGCAHGKRVQALAGAKNHLVVMPDADMDQATQALMGSAFGSAGERCMAVSVAVAVGGVGDALIERLRQSIAELRIGPGSKPESQMGPLITAEHRQRVLGYIEAGIQEGAKLVVDGRTPKHEGEDGGFYVGASVFDEVGSGMRIYREEIFGPVLCVVRVNSFDEAVAIINEHPFGNGVAIFTRDGDAAREFVQRIQVGMVGVNVPIPVPLAFHSFGGWKQSLFGDHHMHGPEGVRFYTKQKTVTSRWPTGIRAGAEFVMPTLR